METEITDFKIISTSKSKNYYWLLGGGAGSAFLFIYAFGILPGFFAWPAGLGDVAVGIVAPFSALALASGKLSITSNRFLAVHAAGLLDFVIAVA